MNSINIEQFLIEMSIPTRFANILKEKKYYTLDSFYKDVEILYSNYESQILFPGQLIAYYPQIIQKVAKNNITCQLSGGIIKKGSVHFT